MWKFVVLVLIGAVLREAQAARRVDAKTVVRRSLSKRSLDNQKRDLGDLLELTPGEGLKPERSETTVKGSRKTRFQETYKGIPIYGSVVTADDEDESDVSGVIFQAIDEDLDSVTPTLTEEEALMEAMTNEGADTVENERVKLIVYIDDSETAHLAYLTSFFANINDTPKRPFNVIEAHDGSVLSNWQGLDTASHNMPGEGGNSKTGKYNYGTDYSHMQATTNDGGTNCVMENNNVKVVNLNHGTSGSTAHTVKCATGATDGINGAFSPANDALYFGTVIYDMFQQWYNSAPLTFKLTMRVHYSSNYENAFWDGSAMTFGDGRNTFYPLVSLDVSAHEVCHGFTEQNSGLKYSAMSGGMNEAFSDMSGEAVEFFMKGSNDWQVGADIFKGNGALRYMDDPTKDGKSIGHASNYYNGMDVHYSSGVYNKAFYLLASKSGWTVRKAFDVMVKANQMYWSATSTFNEGACGVQSAAADLGYNVNDVKDAFSAVGVSCQGNPSPTTAPGGSELMNDVPVSVSGNKGSESHYSLNNQGTSPVTVKISGGSGDVDLYVKYGSAPTRSSYDCRPYKYGNNEECTFQTSKSGKYYVMLHAYSAYNGASLVAAFTSAGPACGGKNLCNGQAVTGLSASSGNELTGYTFTVTSSKTVTIQISGGTGDADLYVKFGSAPSTSSYDARPYLVGNNEVVTFSTPQVGDYHIMIRAYSTFSGVSLQAGQSASFSPIQQGAKKVDVRSLFKHTKKVHL